MAVAATMDNPIEDVENGEDRCAREWILAP
jgi:hypothetical protein